MSASDEPVRVVRVIARMNLGGPAHHVTLLTAGLERRGYHTRLVTGRVGAGEQQADVLTARHGVAPEFIDRLVPEIRLHDDVRAWLALRRIIREFQPHIVHTHTAKAGLVGRLAGITTLRPRPVIVHTFHGHVLRGYFGRGMTAVYQVLERLLARGSDALIGVSEATVCELVEIGVAPAWKFRTVRLGLDLDPFLATSRADGAAVRAQIGATEDDIVICLVGRLVPIKRPDLAVEAFAAARERDPRLRLTIVGDGELRRSVEARIARLGLGDAVTLLGYRHDMTRIAAAADIALISSDNEGTPVWLIEAAAGGCALVTTDVGGVREVVGEGAGEIAPAGDAAALGAALARAATRAPAMGLCAREHVRERYAAARLVEDIDVLYRELLNARAARQLLSRPAC